MDEHKTPEEMNTEETVQPEAAVEETVTDTPSAAEACAQPEEVTAGETAAAEADAGEPAAGEADAAEAPAPAEKKPMSVRARHALRRGVAGLLAAIVLLAVSGFGVFRIARGAQEISGTFDADPGTRQGRDDGDDGAAAERVAVGAAAGKSVPCAERLQARRVHQYSGGLTENGAQRDFSPAEHRFSICNYSALTIFSALICPGRLIVIAPLE